MYSVSGKLLVPTGSVPVTKSGAAVADNVSIGSEPVAVAEQDTELLSRNPSESNAANDVDGKSDAIPVEEFGFRIIRQIVMIQTDEEII